MGDDGEVSSSKSPKAADASTSAKRQTFFGMYSGAKNQTKTTEDLKERAKRASKRLTVITSYVSEDVQDSSSKRKPTMIKAGLREHLAQVRGDKTSVNYYDDELDLDDLFGDEDEEGEDGGNVFVPLQPVEQPGMVASDLAQNMHSKMSKEAQRKRKVTLMKRKEDISGVNPKDFESVQQGLHSAANGKARARMRSQLLTEKFNAKQNGKETLGIRKTIKMTGHKQAKATAYLCSEKNAAKSKERNRVNWEKNRKSVGNAKPKTYAEHDAARKKVGEKGGGEGGGGTTTLPPII
ncbi:hypothetical protein TrRE_jg6811 [Triparma retinervis]|uniref:Uncharacterized protein n=1 Tax=Triparma retinervis TaxID=2557542 RepID=A0A9W6ZHB4_9STRA|nr:hypothetical protein TrRE_jg6811 [Triparma retinervis]